MPLHVPLLLVGDTLRPGGTEGQFVELACGLARSGWNVRAACLRAEGPLRPRLDQAGVETWSCGSGSLRSPRALVDIIQLARKLRGQFIRITHAFDFYSNVLAVLAGRLARTPVVIASQRDLGNLRPPFQQRLHRAILRLADTVTVNSPAVAERLVRARVVPAWRIVVIQNGVDLERFALAPLLATGSPTVVTLGNLRPEKGHADFVRAASLVLQRAPEVRFVIWGDGPLRTSLERQVSEAGLASFVRLGGATPRPEAVLREADIVVLPSRSEATSNVVLEAMATGRAIVATNVGGTPWLVEDEVSGLLVPPGDPEALAKAILRLVEHPGLGRSLAERAADHARARFGIDAMLASIENCYRRLLEEASK